MSCDRGEVLKSFLRNEELRERSGLTEEILEKVSFSVNSRNLLVETLKGMIFSYCKDDPKQTVQRSIQTKIKEYKSYE